MPEDIGAQIAKLNSKLKGGTGKKIEALAELKQISPANGARMRECIPNLIACIRDSDLAVKAGAADVLADIGRSDPASILGAADALVYNLAVPLKSPESYMARGHSAKALGVIAAKNPASAQAGLALMLEALKPPTYIAANPAPHQAVLYAGCASGLGGLTAHSPTYIKGAVPAIAVAALNTDLGVRYNAILGLETIAQKHPDYVVQVIPSVARNLTYPLYRADNSTPQMDRLYLGALFIIGKVAQINPQAIGEAIPGVISCLRDTYVFAQWCSPQALANPNGMRAAASKTVDLLQKANPAVMTTVLIERLNEEREVGQHFENVFLTIAKNNPDIVAPYVLTGLNKPSVQVRRRFIKAVGFIGATKPQLIIDTIPILLDYLKDRDRFMRQAAVFALGGIGLGSPDHIKQVAPGILSAFDDTYENVQLEAIGALENIWLRNPANLGSAVSALNKCLNAQHENIRTRALKALEKMQINKDEYIAFVNEIEATKRIIDEAAEAGTSTKPAEETLKKAFTAVERRDWRTAIQYVKETGETMKKLQMSARPTLSISATTPNPLLKGQLVEVTLRLENTGSSTAKQIKVNLPEEVEVSGMGLIPPIDPGKVRTETLAMRPVDNLPNLRLEVIYFDNDQLEYNANIDVLVTTQGMSPQMVARDAYGGSPRQSGPDHIGRGKSVTGAVDFSSPEFMTTGKRKTDFQPGRPGQEAQPQAQGQKKVASPGMKFCQSCGSEIPKESAFCFKCGQPQKMT